MKLIELRASAAVAMALNPKLRLVRITDGSLLDADSMEMLNALARERDFDVFIERVGTADAGCIVIEAGMILEPDKEVRHAPPA